ncbi:hypothetical protein KP001_07835 [Geomonas subterranea]|uniref:Alpha-tubulin suppressor n=1 Tax=Geomonas subterranea TaxID=2847989 RepID=A0ABX8LQ86_9BACT|nr:hypothetical protein [Geomonas subterranea]QXE92423.1 hypothetical protein KP001_07835 [Geomonas subterranea]QXM09478.1 hypothetical protein KP002_21435 [Geomonas subterranea]
MKNFFVVLVLMLLIGCGGGGGVNGSSTGTNSSGGSSLPSTNEGTNSSTVATLISAKIACGYDHTLAVATDSTVSSLGSNTYGQRGDGTIITSTNRSKVIGLSNIVSVAGGSRHSLALKSDGTVWAWGDNTYGQLGDGTTTSRLTPVHVAGLSNIVQIASNFNYSIALKNDGTVWLWGYGYGNTAASMYNLSNVITVAAGRNHVLVLKKDGTVWSWGDNGSGQLGTGQSGMSLSLSNTPVKVIGLASVSKIAAGDSSSYAIKSDGTVWSWGYGTQLGVSGDLNQPYPLQVTSLAGIDSISSKEAMTYAMKRDAGIGSAFAWGEDRFGETGNSSFGSDVLLPVPISVIHNVVEIEAGFNHAVALLSDGTIYGWGRSSSGQIGNYSPVTEFYATPQLIQNFP